MSIGKQQVLQDVFGFERFRAGQEQVIDALLAGRNALAVMPTGAGKSLCYQVPALVLGGLTIVVSPLVALMQDQVSALQLAGVAAETINSSREREDNIEAWRKAEAGDLRLLYLSPERLMSDRMLSALRKLDVRLIAVDEAHCISQWGPAFRPEYALLQQLGEIFPETPMIALTATADEITRSDIVDRLFAGEAETLVLGFDRPNIQLSVELKTDWKNQLLEAVSAHEGESGIVYCLSRKKTEEAAELLRANGISAVAYHAGMAKAEREENQNRFMSEPGLVVTATIAFGMGIDKADVRFVIHTDLPGSVEAYYQEFGRAGRDGAPASTRMFYGLADIASRRRFIEQEDTSAEHRRREHKRLDALITYCESPSCRRAVLLEYFGEKGEPCGNCDTCLNPVQMTDGTEAGQKALSAIYRTGQRFGAAHIIDILRGADTEKIRDTGHNNLPTYGVGGEHTKQQWQSIIRQLVASGFLSLDIREFGGLQLTGKGAGLLKGEEEFFYRADLVKKSTKSERATARKAAAADLSEDQARLLDRLKSLRLQLAKARNVPAYVIFPDRTLIDMASKMPRTEDEFSDVNGVGAAKLKQFSAPFLEVIAASVQPDESSQSSAGSG
ncbi:MAG: DNA helicase RecQ [Pseudomonadota bacterium]